MTSHNAKCSFHFGAESASGAPVGRGQAGNAGFVLLPAADPRADEKSHVSWGPGK